MEHYRLLIGGELVDSAGGDRIESIDPGSGTPVATAACAGEADAAQAVDAARRAFDSGVWRGKTPAERAEILIEFADLLQSNMVRLARLESQDSGGVIARTHADVFLGAKFIRNMANLAARQFPWREDIPQRNFPHHSVNYLRREPLGVCVGIIPWNFPLTMAIWKIAMATATGNSIVLKPASDTPLSALALGELIQQSRIPKGVVNILAGRGSVVGEALCRHPSVDKIAFTGSTEVGRRILKLAAQGIKKTTMELGGKSANLILEDADMDMALDGALFGSFFHSGQICESGTRLLLPQGLYHDLLERLVERARGIRIGYQISPMTQLGPLVSEKQRESVEKYIEVGRKEARLVLGGERARVQGCDGGFYLTPTIFADVDNRSRIAREEIFGPVLSVIPYADVDRAIAMANDNDYGLACGVWSRDLERAQQVATQLRAGTAWINDYHVFNDYGAFGGYKQSGIGRELGQAGLAEYTELQHVHVGTQADPDNKRGHKLVVTRSDTLGFDYQPTTRIVSGPNSVTRLASEFAHLGKQRVLVITDQGVVQAGLLKRVTDVLSERIAAVYDQVPQDSGFATIDAAAELGRRRAADAVLSLGGGSVIDTGKATVVALTNGINAVQTLGFEQLLAAQLTHVVVPTTAGTGSEVTNVAVIKNHRLKLKSYLVDRYIVPDLAVLDPSLLVRLPRRLTAATGFDALTHAIEAYWSRTANPMADAQALHAIRLIARYLIQTVREPDNLEARGQMQTAATLAGWAFGSANVGLVHACSHALGARHGVPHGSANAILLPHVIRFNAVMAKTAMRLKDVALALGLDAQGLEPLGAARAAADHVASMLEATEHPQKLSEVDVPQDDLAACAAVAHTDPAIFANPRIVFMPNEIEQLFIEAY